MAEGRVNFFDAIDANKRNSFILIFFMILIYLALSIFFAYSFDLGFCLPILAMGIVVIQAFVSYYYGDKIILATSGAKEVDPKENPFLYNVVEGLSLASQIPMPKLYIIPDESINAFATGRDPKHASVAVTTGALNSLNREELEGVLAHEISHVANYDILYSMLAVVFVGSIGLIAQMGSRMLWYGGSSRRDRGGGGGLIILGLIFAILAPIIAQLVQLALSRQREYLADANGARLTRYPNGLANALEKIHQKQIPTQSANSTTASLYFSNPFPNKFLSLFSTHPPIEDRVKRLRSM